MSDQSLTDLITRLQASPAGDRELDALIECALDIRPAYVGCPGEMSVIIGEAGLPLVYWQGVSGTLRATNWEPAPYTSSVDHALALLKRTLPGWKWDIGCDDGSPAMFTNVYPAGAFRHAVLAPTPALALVIALMIALLRALEQTPNTSGES